MMTFDMRCADMVLRGWQPVRTIAGTVGVYSPELRMGFGYHEVYPNPMRRIGEGGHMSITWAQLPEWQLDLIALRLGLT